MKGFIEIPTRSMNAPASGPYTTTLVAVDAIASVSAHGNDNARIVLKTLGSYPAGIVSDTLIAGATYAFLRAEIEKATS